MSIRPFSTTCTKPIVLPKGMEKEKEDKTDVLMKLMCETEGPLGQPLETLHSACLSKNTCLPLETRLDHSSDSRRSQQVGTGFRQEGAAEALKVNTQSDCQPLLTLKLSF